MANNDEKMTLMQQEFIWAFTAFGAVTEGKPYLSAKAAGAKGKDACVSATASRWLRMVKVKTAIEGIIAHRQAVVAVKTGYTIEKAQAEYEEARVLAMHVNQPAAAATATTGKARLYGFDKDNAIGEKTVIIIGPRMAESPIKQVESEVIDEAEV